ncbi:MAG: NAD(P)-dependent oxidoreductase [Thermomicrobiales bacterium]|nr:NAD(P)-dependent oxidoreductase [Thermomicrobiales bacterium]MCO5223108.1 NAD(P)-dependent oxidoreductase [Thermomicrobiales bacterium]
MKLLVTGVTGRVGRNFARSMIASGHDVRGLVLPDDPGHDGAIEDGVDVLVGNLRDPESASAAVAGVDKIMHLGAMMLWGSESMNPTLMDDNIRGTFNLVHAASEAKIDRIVFASSDEVYPSLLAKYLPIDESHPREPYSFYGLTKVAGEEILQYYYRANGLPIAIARFALVYEPWESVSPKGTLGGFLFYDGAMRFVRSRAGDAFADSLAPAGESAPDLLLPRDESGTPWMFHCVDVRDIVQGLTLLLERPEAVGQAFNLSGPAPFSYGEVIPYLAEKAGLTYLDATIPAQPIRIHHSIAKARALLGYDPQHDVFRSIQDGLAATTT